MSDVNQIAISADGQDITITIGDYSDANARAAISVVDAGGDGSLAYNNATGVITYTGPSATDVRAHFSAGTGISIASGVITNTSINTDTTYTVSAQDGTAGKKIIRLSGSDASTDDVTLVQGSNVTLTRAGDEITIASSYTDTNTTYTQNASTVAGGANLNLVGSDATTDTVKFASGTNVTVTRTDADTITIASTDTNTTYTQGVTATSGGANLNLVGSDSTTDTVKFAAGAGITVAETDASTITVTSTITQYTDTLARQAISVATNTGDGDLTYNNTNGQFSYTGPGNAEYRGAVSAANSGTGYGSLSYDSGTGAFTFAKVTGANIRSEVFDGRNLTYTGGGSTLDLDKNLTAVNSATAETATNLTLAGDELVLQTVDVDNASQFLNLNSTGYTFDIPSTTGNIGTAAYATSLGTTTATLNRYAVRGDVTSGSNLITNAVLYDDAVAFGSVVDWTTVTDFVTLPVVDNDDDGYYGYFNLGVAALSITNITGTYDPDPGTNTQTATVTLTVRDTAITASANCLQATESGVSLYFSHYVRNTDATNVILLAKYPPTNLWLNNVPPYRDSSSNGNLDGADIAVTYASYDYTGTQDWQITPRRILNLSPKNGINEHIRVPFALGVGPGSVQTNRGMARDTFDAVGININNNGKINGFAGKTGLNLTQFKNNSFFQSGTPAERCGPNFTFNSFAGNEDTANNALYLNNNDGIGQITWFAQPQASSLSSSTYVPASITVKATETHTASNPSIPGSVNQHGSGMYFQYTPNSMGAFSTPRTFLRAENATTEVLARTTLKLGKISTAANSTSRTLSATAAATWATITDTSILASVPVRTTITQATVAQGGTYTPAVTAMNSIILEVTAGSGTTTIDISNLTVAGENAVFDIMVYNNTGGSINSNGFVILNSGNTVLDHGSSIANGSRAMFEINCVDIYASAKYAGDAV